MSLRRTPRTLEEVVAVLAELQRRLDYDQRVAPTDTRYLYDAKGDILVAAGENDPQRFGVPMSTPGGTGQYVLAANPGRELGVEWLFVSELSGGGGGGSGGGGSGGVTDHAELTGLADDDHPQYLLESAYVAGHVVEDEGTPLTQRATINFVGAGVAATDAGGKTVVTIGGGGGSSVEPSVSDWMF